MHVERFTTEGAEMHKHTFPFKVCAASYRNIFRRALPYKTDILFNIEAISFALPKRCQAVVLNSASRAHPNAKVSGGRRGAYIALAKANPSGMSLAAINKSAYNSSFIL